MKPTGPPDKCHYAPQDDSLTVPPFLSASTASLLAIRKSSQCVSPLVSRRGHWMYFDHDLLAAPFFSLPTLFN